MTAVAVALLTRPPEPESVQQAATPTGLAPDAVEFVAGTDNLLTMCSCSARSTVEQRIAWDGLPSPSSRRSRPAPAPSPMCAWPRQGRTHR